MEDPNKTTNPDNPTPNTPPADPNPTPDKVQEEVKKALETAKAQWEQDFKAKLEAEKAEAEKLSKMSAEQREKAKFEKEREEFERQRREFERQKLELETVKQLAEKNLPTSFASMLVSDTAENTLTNINSFADAFQKAIEEEVNKKLASGVVPKAGTSTTTAVTLEQFKAMNYTQRLNLMNTNKELYDQLSKQDRGF